MAGKEEYKKQLLASKVVDVTQSEGEPYVDLRVTCTLSEQDEKLIPVGLALRVVL